MVFGVILAGGIGSRMGNAEKPKQYIKIGDKPIIIHTIEKFYVHDAFEKLIVLCPKQWVEHTRNLVRQYMGDTDRVVVLEGGETRNETIMNSIRYIEEGYGLDDDTLLHLVQGEVFNIKITYPYDLRVAESLIRNGEMDK